MSEDVLSIFTCPSAYPSSGGLHPITHIVARFHYFGCTSVGGCSNGGADETSVEGNRYFTCSPRHAIFVRPDRVTIGDFPEEDLMASDDDEEI